MTHLCFKCPFTLQVFSCLHDSASWPSRPGNINFSSYFPLRYRIEVCHSILSDNHITKSAFIWWFIWFTRNKVSFTDEGVSPRRVSFIIKNFYEQWLKTDVDNGNGNVVSTSNIQKPLTKLDRAGQNLIWSPLLIIASLILMALKL